jgi:type III secretory pathway component EscS
MDIYPLWRAPFALKLYLIVPTIMHRELVHNAHLITYSPQIRWHALPLLLIASYTPTMVAVKIARMDSQFHTMGSYV